MTIVFLLVLAALFVAYANGANDNFKGVATLYGSRTVGYRRALAWATVTTVAGSLCSVALAEQLVKAFSGKGLVPESVAAEPGFLATVALGAALTVFVAALTGFPISTTHALTGALVGGGLVAAGGGVSFARLGGSFFLPLATSPLLAATFAGVFLLPMRRLVEGPSAESDRQWCLCLETREARAPLSLHTAIALPVSSAGSFLRGEPGACTDHVGPSVIVRPGAIVDVLHFLSSGAVSFARGLNDAPKIVGLLVVLQALRVEVSLTAVALAMAIGGLIHARRVAETVSKRITSMTAREGLMANLVTSALVIGASFGGFPVSTTHVSCGSIFGMGLAAGSADQKIIGQILTSWLLTLPIAAALAAGFAAVLF